MKAGQITCCWCEKHFEQSALKGPAANLCPFCEDPVLPAAFSSLPVGEDFACKMGGAWTKTSATQAELQDGDSRDKPCEFRVDEDVYPF